MLPGAIYLKRISHEVFMMDEKKLDKVADRLHLFLPLFYKKILSWHKNTEGYNPAHYMVMGLLMNLGPMSMTDLSRKICSSKPGVTNLTDRLITDGKLAREYDVNDRRVIYVSVTEAGREFMRKHRMEEKEEIKKNLSTLSDGDLEVMCESLDNLREIITRCSEVKNAV
jgi:DNA-binding MarR family transcriptional regulator